jgi:hypothetical protein
MPTVKPRWSSRTSADGGSRAYTDGGTQQDFVNEVFAAPEEGDSDPIAEKHAARLKI